MVPRSLAAAALAALLALPACDKKKPPANPDTAPPPTPVPVPRKDPGPKDQDPEPAPPADPGLPTFPAQRPVYASTAAPFRAVSESNLKQIGTAFHNAHDALSGFPAGVAGKAGKVGLSWRVALLPYLDQDALYRAFKLDEPWDSEHNRKLIGKMPKVFAPGNVGEGGFTFYRAFTGPGTVMPPPARPGQPGQTLIGARFTQVTDGTSNTMLVAEAYDPVIWTKPDELAYAPGKPPVPGGGLFGHKGFHALMCDGSVRRFPNGLPDGTLENAIRIADGNIIEFP